MNITKLFTRKSEGSKYMPQQVISATSQKHEMLITLLAAYPDGVPTWKFNMPEIGIMNQWDVCMALRKRGVRIATDYAPHTNRYGRSINIAAYRILPEAYQRAVEVEIKMRGGEQ